MNRTARLAGVCLAACMAATMASAGFVNGGFEDGTFNGWTQNGGTWYGPIGSYTYTGDPGQSAIVTQGSDPILIGAGVDVPTVYSGTYSVRVNNHSDGGGAHFSTISQTAVWTDPHMFFAWSAVIEDPGHSHDSQPHFSIILHDDTAGADLYNIVIAADTVPPGTFQTANVNGSSWEYSGWQIVDLDIEALGAVGHTLSLTLLAADCALGGHAGTVYLDGFGAAEPTQNEPPVADAGPDQTVPRDTPTGASVTLDGSGSSDPEDGALTYAWTWAGGSASGVNPTVALPQGETIVTLVVNDGELDSDPDTVTITVTNTAPVADAGGDRTVEKNCAAGATVTLDGSASTDANGDALTYSWTWDGGSAEGVGPTVLLPLGETTVSLVVNDGELDSAPDTQVITVVRPAPRRLKQLVVAYLTERLTAVGDTDRWVSGHLAEAIGHVQQSLAPHLWEDDDHVSAKGKRVFKEEAEAVEHLQKILGNPSADPAVLADAQAAVDDLVAADEALVLTAIAEGLALVKAKDGKSPLDKVGELYDQAMTAWEAGECCDAINDFCKAWQKAVKATEKGLK